MSLEERVMQLERKLVLWQRIGFALAVLTFGGVIATGNASQFQAIAQDKLAATPVIRTTKLEVVDSAGKVVATLASEKSGPYLHLSSSDNASARISAQDDSASLSLRGPALSSRLTDNKFTISQVTAAQRVILEKFLKETKAGKAVDYSEEERAEIRAAIAGRPLITLGQFPPSNGGVSMVHNANGDPVVIFLSDKTNGGVGSLRDANGNEVK